MLTVSCSMAFRGFVWLKGIDELHKKKGRDGQWHPHSNQILTPSSPAIIQPARRICQSFPALLWWKRQADGTLFSLTFSLPHSSLHLMMPSLSPFTALSFIIFDFLFFHLHLLTHFFSFYPLVENRGT